MSEDELPESLLDKLVELQRDIMRQMEELKPALVLHLKWKELELPEGLPEHVTLCWDETMAEDVIYLIPPQMFNISMDLDQVSNVATVTTEYRRWPWGQTYE